MRSLVVLLSSAYLTRRACSASIAGSATATMPMSGSVRMVPRLLTWGRADVCECPTSCRGCVASCVRCCSRVRSHSDSTAEAPLGAEAARCKDSEHLRKPTAEAPKGPRRRGCSDSVHLPICARVLTGGSVSGRTRGWGR